MSQTTINTTDSPETGRGKINDNFTELYLPITVKRYVALLTQSGTSAPTATVLYNTLGGTVSYTYTDVGVYTAICTGKITRLKTVVLINKNRDAESTYVVCATKASSDDDAVGITSSNAGSLEDSLIDNVAFIIEVYP